MRINADRILAILGPAPKPERVSENQFDGHDAELARMATLDWDRIPEDDFWYYFHDLAYVELQPDLFRHLFPACLKFWYDTLMRNDDAARGDSEFHYSLMRGHIAERMLTETERQAVYDFFRDGFLDRLEAERGFVYQQSHDPMVASGISANAWIFRFNSLGIVAPVIPPIWEAWWKLDHPGKAVCAVMYASGLVYRKGENPIYGIWSREYGGGGPYLTESDSSIFDWAWRRDNLDFLRDTLSAAYLADKLAQAAAALAAFPEAAIAQRIAADAPSRAGIIQSRTAALLDNLSRLQLDQDHWE